MIQPPLGSDPDRVARARSFGAVADAYDRARPGYPAEAAAWLAGPTPVRMLELGAGTGKLTSALLRLGHQVIATDPSERMLRLLHEHEPHCPAVVAPAERIPLPARSVDVVVSAQAFHWFDLPRALPEIARVLRPGGRLALAWNKRDSRVPWVRRLGTLMGAQEEDDPDPTQQLVASQLFGFVESATFRFWQPYDRRRLRELALSRSYVATLPATRQERVLAEVARFYDDYGRGPDGMLLPYLTRCFAATVRAPALDEPPREDPPDGDGSGSLLIDFS